MSATESMANGLNQNLEMLKMHLADFSEAEMFKRPCTGANHAAWQLGHLATAEAGMTSAASNGKVAPLPKEFTDKFAKETHTIDDPKAFPSKAELIATIEKVRADVIAWTRTLSPEDLAKPSPEKMRRFAATVGDLLGMMPVHTAMHIGQFQVIRRSLHKPILF